MSRASARKATFSFGSSKIARRDSPIVVPPGSLVKTAFKLSATRRAWVVLPLASPPSKAMNCAFMKLDSPFCFHQYSG